MESPREAAACDVITGSWSGKESQVICRWDGLQRSVLHPVLVNVEIMKNLRVTGGGARQQAFLFLSHQPLAVFGSHVAGHVLLGPGVQPGLEASVQACVDPLVGLEKNKQCNLGTFLEKFSNIGAGYQASQI